MKACTWCGCAIRHRILSKKASSLEHDVSVCSRCANSVLMQQRLRRDCVLFARQSSCALLPCSVTSCAEWRAKANKEAKNGWRGHHMALTPQSGLHGCILSLSHKLWSKVLQEPPHRPSWGTISEAVSSWQCRRMAASGTVRRGLQ